MIKTDSGICDRLKQETQALHDVAEKHPFQQALVAGQLTQQAYGRFLAQMFHLHRSLERCIADSGHPAVPTVIKPLHFQSLRLIQDMDHLELEDRTATPGTEKLITEIELMVRKRPAALLGFHYVLEGSNNGSRFIARSIRRAFGFTEAGTLFLDPYGDEQRPIWMDYRAALNAVDFTMEESQAVLTAAKRMFQGVAALCDDLEPACT